MKIDINEKGEVENVRVVDGDKRNLFQDEARRAVEKWKYRPFLGADSKPLRKADHQVRVDFKLSEA
jgi:protein TonB